jgi:hypothetical protein
VKQYNRRLVTRRLWETEWRDLARYILPRKSNTLLGATPGGRQTTQLYDGTAIKANEDLAATMQGTLTSSALRWFVLKMRRKDLNDLREVGEWLDESADRMYLALQQSNFEAEMYEVYLDLGAFGIGALLLEESDLERPGFNGFRFLSMSVGEFVIAEDAARRVNSVMRKFNLAADAALARFGDALSDRAKEWARTSPEREIAFLHVIARRPGGMSEPDTPASNLPWASTYVEIGEVSRGSDLGMGNARVVEDGGYHEFPLFVPRWSRSGDELYGRGPGHVALPDVRSMNKAMDFTFSEWGLAIRPPQKALHGGVAGTIRQTPAAITWLYDMNALAPWDRGAQFTTNLIERKELAQKIRAAFFGELLDLPPIQGTPMSATEVARRFEIMERKLGPTIGRQKSELLGPMIDRMFGLMYRAGALSPPPPVLAEEAQRGGGQIDVEYEGPLARAQRATDLVAIERKNAWVASVIEIKPEVSDNFDYDAEARHVADVAGLPARLKRDQTEVTKIRAIRAREQVAAAEMAAAQQMADIAARGGRGIKNLAEAGKNGQGAPE